MGEIIYEKHFHQETIEEIERERIDFLEAFGEDAEQALDLCQYFGQKKLKYYADFFSSSSSLCCGVI